jgi:hypothetical protein
MGAPGARRSALRSEERPMRRRAAAAGRRRALLRRARPIAGAWLAAFLTFGAVQGSGGANAHGQATLYAGLGFDTCEAPSLTTLQAWLASPYRALGIYIGGANRACTNAQLSASWVASAEGIGWAIAPLYVGLQAPCGSQGGLSVISPQAAAGEGTSAADDAIASASQLGLPAGSPIYFDMEGYALDNPGCTQTVQTFLSAWVAELHNQGYLAGVYGSAGSTMRDLQALTTTSSAPDDVWIADWNGDTSVFGDPYVSDGLWTDHQRIHQFSGGHHETYGGITLDIDGDSLDGAVVGAAGGAQVSPAPTPTPTASTLSAAGSVASADGVASVSWQAGTFQRSVVVSLTPSLPATPVPGFGSGGYGVQLQVQQTATSLATTSFTAPLTIHIAPQQQPSLAPVSSSNGTSWQALPELVGDLLPVGVSAGYARQPDGSIEIQTRSSGLFALLPDSAPPPAPAALEGHFSHGSLVLSWPASTDPTGAPVAYQVSLTGQPLLTVAGQTVAALRAFHPHAPSVYRVRAIDAAGELSSPSPPLVVLPSQRPSAVPRALPAWAWLLFSWQLQGQVGTRPAAPLPPPAWYWQWRAWRIAPFHLRA